MIELDNIDKFVEEVQKIIYQNKIRVISVDGDTGAGKSTLARSISKRMGITHLKLDNERYLHQNKGGYVNYIKYDILLNEINGIVNSDKIVIVDGVCILKILDNVKIKSDLKVYVKRVSYYGHWYDGSKFDYSKSASEIIQEGVNGARRLNEIVKLPDNNDDTTSDYKKTVFDEIVEYHFEYKPDESASIIYYRIENHD